MKTVKSTSEGVKYIRETLKRKQKVVTQVVFWKIPHNSSQEDICLKIGRFHKVSDKEGPESLLPKSELTLDNDEFTNLINFLGKNYEPFREGFKSYIAINEEFDSKTITSLKSIFRNQDKENLLNIMMEHDILPDELLVGLRNAGRVRDIEQFEEMLGQDLMELKWQQGFTENEWVLGGDFVRHYRSRVKALI